MKCPLCENHVTKADFDYNPDPEAFSKIKKKIEEYRKNAKTTKKMGMLEVQ